MSDLQCPELFIASTTGIDEARAAHLSTWLDNGETARADRLRNRNARRDFIAAHALRRLALSRCFPGNQPGAWVIEGEAGSRPAVAGHPDIGISLSHAEGLAAVAVARGGRVGVDAEAVESGLATLATAQTFCAPEELHALAAGAGSELACEDFFMLWTLKESLLKATGAALATPPEAIAFSLSPPVLRNAPAAFGSRWSFWTFRTGPYRLSVAADVAGASRLPLPQTLWDLVAEKPMSHAGFLA